ncbi:hypothetical protein ACWDA7_44820 [Streptomyces sp. NPDC001156]
MTQLVAPTLVWSERPMSLTTGTTRVCTAESRKTAKHNVARIHHAETVVRLKALAWRGEAIGCLSGMLHWLSSR